MKNNEMLNIKKILIVDDDISILDSLSEAIEFLGWKPPLVAENIDKAIEIAFVEYPDIIFTDQQMPTMLGTDLIKKLRKDNLSFTAVLLSSIADLKKIAFENNINFFLKKPFSLNELKSTLEKVSDFRKISGKNEKKTVKNCN